VKFFFESPQKAQSERVNIIFYSFYLSDRLSRRDGYRGGPPPGPRHRMQRPPRGGYHNQNSYGRDPYHRGPRGGHPRDPYARDPYHHPRYAHAREPYHREPYARDSYNRDHYNQERPPRYDYQRYTKCVLTI